MQRLYIGQTDRWLELRFKEHIRCITSNNPKLGYALCILHKTHEYGPMETSMILLHSAQKTEHKNALENYYIHYFYKHNMTIREQNQEEKKSIIRNNPQCAIPTLRRISPRLEPSYFPRHTSVPTSVLHRIHITYRLVSTSSTTVSPFTTFY